MADYDDVALHVLAHAGGSGAVMFEGWLAPATDAAAQPAIEQLEAAGGGVAQAPPEEASYRLYTDSQFMEFLEIPVDALLYQINGTARPDGMSLVWVKRETRITRCQSGYAHQFGELETGETADDPTARRPRPYPPRP